MHLVVGSWNFMPVTKGLTMYAQDGRVFKQVAHILPDVTVGQQFADQERGIVYITHESDQQHNSTEPGGSLFAIRVDTEAEKFQVLSECPSMGSKPSYVWVDRSKAYLVVSHHAGRNSVVKIEQDTQGKHYPVRVYEDTTLALFRLNKDGSIGDLCDIKYYAGTNQPGPHTRAHLHNVMADPSGEMYLVCDKGRDKIYTLRIDRKHGKLVQTGETDAMDMSAPRYAAFHPWLPVVYVNHELKSYVSAYRYDVQTGTMAFMQDICLTEPVPGRQDVPSDLAVAQNGKSLYATVRGADQIAVLHLGAEGGMELIQNISCGGKTPRGLALSPDGTYLLVANQDSNQVSRMRILADGSLAEAEEVLEGNNPGTVTFWA